MVSRDDVTAVAGVAGVEGESIEPSDVTAEDASVANEPTDSTDVARKTEVDSKADDEHGNDAHSEAFVSDGAGTERQIWVIDNGASDPAGAGDDDLIFEREA